jgi:hypothetical protein
MKLKAGIVFGVAVVVWQLIIGFTGLYTKPGMDLVFILVATLITAGVLFWGLKQIAAEGRGYWGLVGSGMVIALIACVLIILGSFLFTTLFPDYADVALTRAAEQAQASGATPEQQEMQMKVAEALTSPVAHAVTGVIGALLTSFVVSLIVAAIVRQK